MTGLVEHFQINFIKLSASIGEYVVVIEHVFSGWVETIAITVA